MISDEAESSPVMPSAGDPLEASLIETKQLRGTGNMVCNCFVKVYSNMFKLKYA